ARTRALREGKSRAPCELEHSHARSSSVGARRPRASGVSALGRVSQIDAGSIEHLSRNSVECVVLRSLARGSLFLSRESERDPDVSEQGFALLAPRRIRARGRDDRRLRLERLREGTLAVEDEGQVAPAVQPRGCVGYLERELRV